MTTVLRPMVGGTENAPHTEILTVPKVVEALSDVHVPQCRDYLRATGKPLCLLINFGRPKVEIRRITAEA